MRTDKIEQYLDTTSLFEHCFQNFQSVSISDIGSKTEGSSEDKGIMNNHESFAKLDENAHVVLPVTADVSEVEMTLIHKDLPEDVIAQLRYTYGGHVAGEVDVVFSEAEVEEDYFDGEKKSEGKNVIEIKSATILKGLGIIVAIAAVFLIGKRLYDNFYVILHDMEVKKQRKARFRPVSRKRRKWKRRDRMFK